MILAVLDTGCYLHQDFIEGFDISASVFWENAGEEDCTDGIDNDGNGYVDDCFGWVSYKSNRGNRTERMVQIKSCTFI